MSRRTARYWEALVMGGLLAVLGAAEGAGPVCGGSYEAWQRQRGAVLANRSVVRYYAFQELGGGVTQAPNLAGAEGALSWELVPKAGAPAEPLQVVEGRWPGKKAVRLDQGRLHGEPFEVKGKSFTVEAWLRANGPGAHRGNAESTNGTLLSIGVGYWDGWRLTYSYPSEVIGFEIGRPQPSSSVGITTGPVPSGVWHHLAATWDGREMRVYVDGLPASRGDYAGEYTPPPNDRRFRIGFADSGWGSVILDVDEVTVHDRRLSGAEVLQDAHFYAPLPATAAERFAAANVLFEGRKHAEAAAGYGAIAQLAGLHPDYQALARLRRAAALQEQRKLPEAAAALAQVVDAPGLPDSHRQAALVGVLQLIHQGAGNAIPRSVLEKVLSMAETGSPQRTNVRIEIARALRDGRDYQGARAQYRELLALPDLPPRDRLNLRLELGDTCREAGDARAARAEFTALAQASDAPPVYRSLARLRIARTYVKERNDAAARAEYEALQALPDAPASHRWEAGERLKEIERLRQGLPARDPAWSRVKLPPRPAAAVTLYVAPNGADTNAGTKARPFATLQRARDAVRALKQKGGLPAGGVAVVVRGGEYRATDSLKLTAEDSGAEKAPICYRAAEGERPRFTGGVRLSGFQAVTDAAVLSRLPETAGGKVMQVDLRAAGVTDFGEAFGQGKRPDLYFDGKPMPISRWPNEGFVTVGELLGSQRFDVWGSVQGNRDGKFTYEGDRPNRWREEKDIWLYGYWFWDWADSYERVASVDTEERVITTAPPYHGYGFRKSQRYYAVNLLSEIDMPGEWYLDRASGTLYFHPPSDPTKATVELSVLGKPLVEMDGASHVTLQGLTLECGRNNGVVIKGGSDCLLAACTVCRLGENAVILEGGSDHGLLGCDLYTLGRGGTVISGGDRKTLTPGRHFIENCHVHDFSRIYRTYTPAVLMNGVGNRIAHNLFHDAPHHAMRIEGNDHVIELNEVHNVVYEADDQGGVDMWYNAGYRGNVFRYNYWHHIGSGLGCGQAGIRLDDAICGVLIYGNVFYKCSGAGFGAVQIHGGKENVVENNLFVDCRYAVSFSPWGEASWKKAITEGMKDRLTQEVDVYRPPYSTRYPELAHLLEDPDANLIRRNVAYNCGEFLTRDRGVNEVVDNYLTARDPGFADAAGGDFRLKDDAPAYTRLGLEPIPFGEIGLYQDRLRASWPVAHPVSRNYVPPPGG